ncbi:FtsX-like permease family protein [Duganella sp. FT80W]|uniref:FtsX-like permease family protein n=1 Tax=Duganella guangzhouensis TaxID=2666084 RepID=A0A6I2KVI6_9BURK|nr:FtsX-like permease family protein [Duganella guangzhouensis]MRW90075.1 FtsX-like permease family protein [Duganella guangzhouensis]
MTLRDFRIGWRLLVQQPAYSLVVIGGLAVGFAACFLLFGYVAFCLNFNSSIPDNDRVVAVKQRINVFPRPDWQLIALLRLRDVARDSGMVSTSIMMRNLDTPLRAGAELRALDLQVADPDFRTLFGIHAIEGDLQAALTQPDGLALTRLAAAKLFGTRQALGQSVQAGDVTLQVRALLPDPPANSSLQYEALVGTASSAWPERDTAFSKNGRGRLYMKLKPDASPATLTALLQEASERDPFNQRMRNGAMGKSLNGRNVADIRLLPLRDAYFDEDMAASRSGESYGRRSSVYGLAAGGLLILLLAAINYVNLATVRTLRRQREIGLRKLLGASAGQLIRQFLSEAILTTLLAAVLGLMLAWLLLPTFSDLLNRRLDGMFTPLHCVIALGFSIVIGVCAGAYPAWLARHALPATALAGRDNSETMAGLWLRRVLTVLQFASAMALSAATLAVGWQTWYASHASPGLDIARLLLLDLPGDRGGKPAADAFLDQLRRLPGVDSVATISEAVGRDGLKIINVTATRDGNEIPLEAKYVSPNWFDANGLRALYGRTFNPRIDPHDDKDIGGVLLNAEGAAALGYATPQEAVGQTLPPAGAQIIGIAPEVRYQGLHAPSKALVYRVRSGEVVMLRTALSPQAAYALIEPLWQRNFPNAILEIQTQQAVLANRYAGDARLMRILAISSLTAIALAAFGIYVLSAYSVQRSRREIVLRKLHGAAGKDIALMLAREFSALVAAGAIIGLPLAALATQRYLAGYTEHAPVGIWTLAAALLLAVLVALLATTRHTLTAMRMPPMLALKD